MAKIKAVSITIERAEGRKDECVTVKVSGPEVWSAANAVLWRWSHTAPKGGAYNKCDFTVEYEDGEKYEGRYDLHHFEYEAPDLAKHMRRHCGVYAGRLIPGWVKEEDVEQFKAHIREVGKQEQYCGFLDRYEIGNEA